ncbi:MAG: rhodanese-like domain-containing protein [Gammaproteobacteria bacterium]
MKAQITNPVETAAEFEQGGGVRYIDVRTVAEFVSGHPRGPVVNIPILFHHPHHDETFPNDSFLLVVDDNFARDDQIIIGDQDGERGELAADKLIDAGYTNVSVMLGGLKQWQQCALPVTGDNRDGVSYVSLLTPAKRKKKSKSK